jgi:hypothetical protein
MLDTAGRLSIDEELMAQVEAVRDVANPRETLLVVDGLTGQDAVNVARTSTTSIGITGVVLTRMDGDGRGGAALSMRAVTGKPIRFVGLGEKMDALETFEPERIAGRILGMGDIVSPGRKGAGNARGRTGRAHDEALPEGSVQHERPQGPARADDEDGRHGGHDGHDARHGQDAKQLDEAGFDDKVIKRQIALIQSMTKKERANPQILLQASRKKRIAKGAGRRCQRPQQASEDAPPDGRHDEEDGQDGQEGHGADEAPELGWLLAPEARGQGFAAEAAAAARDAGLAMLGGLASYVAADNLPSGRVARRLGALLDRADSLRLGVDVWRHADPATMARA